MAFCEIEFSGKSLGKMASMNVLLPEGESEGPFPVLYLLHGYSDNHTAWCRRSAIERHVMGKDLIVVMPDGYVSFYANDPRPGGMRYEDHIIEDVIGFVDRMFPTVAARQGRSIAGLSMGGYGALMLAMKHPDLFCATSSLSGAVDFAHKLGRLGSNPHTDRIPTFSDTLFEAGGYDCYELARQTKDAGRDLAVRFDCGENDFLIEANRGFHAFCDEIGLDHEYVEHPGVHDWKYWDTHIPETIEFVLKAVSS